ncbi:DUF2812 domain-containing protein [Pseudoduganella violaceinigra]|uniref:DUF2812 domain-containing protein n=1 Tax=Pseudoduganella violaceinigra TaxID=246602 RepID=UPI000418FC20|nr:DUF2812 domain-containing protein [Pseudoduganella violaceinigra]
MTKLVRKIRWFWDDADHAIERWLEQMAREGLHFKRVNCMRTAFYFERGEPAEVNYRIDFRLTRVDPHYLQLFKDAGWEHVDQLLGWQFWRAPAGMGQSAEIFTDVESMSRKYKYLIWLFVVPMVLQLPFTVMRIHDRWGKTPGAVAVIIGVQLLSAYCIVRLIKRLRSLKMREA